MPTVLGEIDLYDDATITVLRHEDGSITWQLDICTTDDLRDDDNGDPVVQCQRQAAAYLAGVIMELEQDIAIMETGAHPRPP